MLSDASEKWQAVSRLIKLDKLNTALASRQFPTDGYFYREWSPEMISDSWLLWLMVC